jgi:hypothetical protein
MDTNRTLYDRFASALTLVAGGLIGATVGILFAPRSGLELREDAWEKFRDAGRKLKEKVSWKMKKAEHNETLFGRGAFELKSPFYPAI